MIKIDVEGAELEVVAGMSRLLADIQPVVICEMHGKNREFCEQMQAADYYVLNLDGPESIRDADQNAHVLCVPRRHVVA